MSTHAVERARIHLSPVEWRWLGIALVALCDAVLLAKTGIALGRPLLAGYGMVLGPVSLLTLFYTYWRENPGLAALTQGAMQAILFSLEGKILSYLVLTFQAPLVDQAFSDLDAMLGLDWMAWFGWLDGHRTLRNLLILTYQSVSVQLLLLIVLLPALGRQRYLSEFFTAAMVALLIIIPVWGFIPALGAWVHFGVGLADADWLPDVLAMRAGTMPVLGEQELYGIIVFPSFHTSLGMLITYAMRWNKYALAATGLLNGAMILSVPIVGSHYFVDVLAGALVTLVAMLVANRVEWRSAGRPVVQRAISAGP